MESWGHGLIEKHLRSGDRGMQQQNEKHLRHIGEWVGGTRQSKHPGPVGVGHATVKAHTASRGGARDSQSTNGQSKHPRPVGWCVYKQN